MMGEKRHVNNADRVDIETEIETDISPLNTVEFQNHELTMDDFLSFRYFNKKYDLENVKYNLLNTLRYNNRNDLNVDDKNLNLTVEETINKIDYSFDYSRVVNDNTISDDLISENEFEVEVQGETKYNSESINEVKKKVKSSPSFENIPQNQVTNDNGKIDDNVLNEVQRLPINKSENTISEVKKKTKSSPNFKFIPQSKITNKGKTDNLLKEIKGKEMINNEKSDDALNEIQSEAVNNFSESKLDVDASTINLSEMTKKARSSPNFKFIPQSKIINTDKSDNLLKEVQKEIVNSEKTLNALDEIIESEAVNVSSESKLEVDTTSTINLSEMKERVKSSPNFKFIPQSKIINTDKTDNLLKEVQKEIINSEKTLNALDEIIESEAVTNSSESRLEVDIGTVNLCETVKEKVKSSPNLKYRPENQTTNNEKTDDVLNEIIEREAANNSDSTINLCEPVNEVKKSFKYIPKYQMPNSGSRKADSTNLTYKRKYIPRKSVANTNKEELDEIPKQTLNNSGIARPSASYGSAGGQTKISSSIGRPLYPSKMNNFNLPQKSTQQPQIANSINRDDEVNPMSRTYDRDELSNLLEQDDPNNNKEVVEIDISSSNSNNNNNNATIDDSHKQERRSQLPVRRVYSSNKGFSH